MRVRKFKIKVDRPGENPLDVFKRETIEDIKRVQRGEKVVDSEYDIVISFPDISWLNKIVSTERLRIYQTIKDKKPSSIYELAKLLGRAVANVQRDVKELAEFGVIELRKTRKKGQKRETIQPECNWDVLNIAV
jgi:predicted transcriptional regulator